MNRRGFTLIELIVTLALLAIISVISFVAIGGVLEDNKMKDCKNLVSSIKTAAKEYVSDNRYGDLSVNSGDDGKKISVTAKYLIDNNYLDGVLDENPLDRHDNNYTADSILVDVYVYDDLTVKSVYVRYRENDDSVGFDSCQ